MGGMSEGEGWGEGTALPPDTPPFEQLFYGGKMMVEGLSEDHSVATSPSERDRLRKEFPDLPAIITMGDAELEEHGTVMGLCRFTRSIGDCHMKSTASVRITLRMPFLTLRGEG